MGVHKISFAKLKKLNSYGVTYKNYSLKSLTTFKIGGNAKFYLEINNLESFVKVMLYLNDYPNVFIIGNGSNLLVSDKGYDGVVIRLKGNFTKILIRDDCLEVGAGIMLSEVISFAKTHNLGGMEKAIGIPGTIGGAVVMNCGAYGFEMSQVVTYVIAFVDGKINYFTNEMCKFGYRESIFSTKSIILRVGLKLEKSNSEIIQRNILQVIEKRKNSQPINFPSAGSVFKRIDGFCVSQMLEQMGVKNMRIGDACVSEKHANFIVNLGNASANDVYFLILKIKKMFLEKYNLELNTEIKFIGEFYETDG